MSQAEDVIARHQGYSHAVKQAWERAADGLTKVVAGQHLERADTAALSGNEVDFLLETYRAERMLRDIDRNERRIMANQYYPTKPEAVPNL